MRHRASQSCNHLGVLQIPMEAQNAQFAGRSTCHAGAHGKSTTVYFASFAVKCTMHAISAKVSCMNAADCRLQISQHVTKLSGFWQLAIKGPQRRIDLCEHCQQLHGRAICSFFQESLLCFNSAHTVGLYGGQHMRSLREHSKQVCASVYTSIKSVVSTVLPNSSCDDCSLSFKL